ncbi:MAG: transporter substrate-binding domain-containing protein [Clostridia bacterium]|nr:transporter substrate-binding domain-containing protein [Clostridia bacterium]
MKKIISLVLALALLCGCAFTLASCGGKDTVVSKIGAQKGTTSKMYADILKGIEVVSYDTFALAAKDMKNGNVDYVIVDKTTGEALCREISDLKINPIALSSENYGIAIDKAQANLKTQIDAILAEKDAEIQAIKDKYMNNEEASFVGVTPVAKDTAKADQQLVVATNAEFAPWEYKEGNQYFGIDMEIAALLAEELGMELVIEDMDFDNVVGSVGKQGIDIAMSGITITAERADVVNFSTPYYTESIVIVHKAADTSLASCGTVVDLLTVLCVASEEE